MAKPHRMAALTMAAVVAAVVMPLAGALVAGWILWTALLIVAVGSGFTAFRRLAAVAAHLRTVKG